MRNDTETRRQHTEEIRWIIMPTVGGRTLLQRENSPRPTLTRHPRPQPFPEHVLGTYQRSPPARSLAPRPRRSHTPGFGVRLPRSLAAAAASLKRVVPRAFGVRTLPLAQLGDNPAPTHDENTCNGRVPSSRLSLSLRLTDPLATALASTRRLLWPIHPRVLLGFDIFDVVARLTLILSIDRQVMWPLRGAT